MTKRRLSRPVTAGGVQIGGGAPIPVQSMLNTPAHDFAGALALTERLQKAGCDIVRLAVPDVESAQAFSRLRAGGITLPLVADIHFDYTLALASVKAGASKIRINPGNIGAEWKVREVAEACKAAGIPCRKHLLGKRAQGIAICRRGQLSISPADQLVHFDEFLHTVLAPV